MHNVRPDHSFLTPAFAASFSFAGVQVVLIAFTKSKNSLFIRWCNLFPACCAFVQHAFKLLAERVHAGTRMIFQDQAATASACAV